MERENTQACAPTHDREDQLLIESAVCVRDPAQVIHISQFFDPSLDWDYILTVAGKNAILPFVGRNMLQSFPHLVPNEVKDILTERLHELQQRNLYLTRKLIEIVRLFEAANIPVLPFKGPLLAAQAYGDVSARQYIDLDILVQPKHLERAAKVLLDQGYHPDGKTNRINRSNWRMLDKKDIHFRTTDQLVNVELHWKLSGSHFSLPFEVNGLWARLERFCLAGVQLRTLPLDDLLIYLCLHGSRHGWERFGWICDVHELIRSHVEIEWEPLLLKARQLGCENVLGLGLCLVHAFFGVEFSFSSWPMIRDDVIFVEFAKRIRSQLFSRERVVMGLGDRYAYHLKLKENRGDKWKLHFHYILWYLRIIFTPRTIDTNVFNFPRALEPLYYIMRPLRLFYNYALKPNKRAF